MPRFVGAFFVSASRASRYTRCTSLFFGLPALPQNACYVPLSVQDSENLKGLASGFIDDEVGKDPVEKNLPAGEIGAAVTAVWHVSQLVDTLEERSEDPVRRLHALLLSEV